MPRDPRYGPLPCHPPLVTSAQSDRFFPQLSPLSLAISGMPTVQGTLTKGLEPPIRIAINRRIEAMTRQIAYLDETKNRRLARLHRRGWTNDRLYILCALNSFYQIVIGPLASSARHEGKIGLGERIPIDYGDQITFDAERARLMRGLHAAFLGLVAKTRLPTGFLHANHADDLNSGCPIHGCPTLDNWLASVERACERFADKHAITYRKSEREISASFEIGCFHALVEFYEASWTSVHRT